MPSAMLSVKAQTEALQAFRFHRADFVRPRHGMPQLGQKTSETAHAASGYTNKVNSVMLTSDE